MGRPKGAHTRTTWLEDGRWTLWQCMRVLRIFTLPQLRAVTGCSAHNAKRYVRCLEQAGYVRRLRERQRGVAGSHTVFALIEDTGPVAPRGQTDGKRLFVHYCATCHGDAGQGDGQNAYNLDPPPPDFHESLKVHQPSYWRQIIEGGSVAVGRSPQCPPWGRTLASSDLDALVAYLEVLANPSPAQK